MENDDDLYPKKKASKKPASTKGSFGKKKPKKKPTPFSESAAHPIRPKPPTYEPVVSKVPYLTKSEGALVSGAQIKSQLDDFNSTVIAHAGLIPLKISREAVVTLQRIGDPKLIRNSFIVASGRCTPTKGTVVKVNDIRMAQFLHMQ